MTSKGCESCACGGERQLDIFSPANCQKLPFLWAITGGGIPGREISIKLNCCPEVFTEIDECGTFRICNPYILDEGYHTIKVTYCVETEAQDCECVESECPEDTVTRWVYISGCDCDCDCM